MALRIYQNTFALNSQRTLGLTQSELGKSIERLSSGLRINHAADDASGLAISEKLRGQIKGLKRSTMNAQDGISMLQVAEGALGEVSNMLQRMRELAVQAANGTYTSGDRAELQKEVDQLKDEIDRISNATEFNTKKLLNGSGTGLWASDTERISAVIRDNVREGNYEIEMSVTPGSNQVYKSQIMTMKEGAIGVEITSTANQTNVGIVSDPNSVPVTGTSYFTVSVGNGSETSIHSATISLAGTYQQNGGSWTIDTATIVTADFSGYVEIEFLETTSSAGTIDATDYRYRTIDAKTGTLSQWYTATTTTAGLTINNTAAGIQLSADLTLGVAGSIIDGDKILFSVSDKFTAAVSLSNSGGGTIQITGGPTAYTGPTLIFTGESSLTVADNGDTFVDYQDTKVYLATLNAEDGNLDLGNFNIRFKENTQTVDTATAGLTLSGSFTIAIRGGGEAAATSTKLKDIGAFVDADGNNIFENKQELTIFGNGLQTTIFIEGDDTLADLESSITDALVNDLGMGSDDTTVNNHLVDYVSVADPSGDRAVRGTFVMQSAMTGEQGEIAFIGSQALLDALALSEIHEAKNNETFVTIRDAHTGELIGSDTTGDDHVVGLLDGVEMVLDSRAAVTSSWSAGTTGRIVFGENTALASQKYHLHIVDSSTDLQIGPNSGQDFSVSIPQLDVKGLGIDNVLLVSQRLSQRAIADIDNAITMAVTTRSTIGAQISRLEHTIVNLQTATENMTASESRIRDLDIAEEMTTFTRSQILNQAGVGMLAQANQLPQMALQLLQG